MKKNQLLLSTLPFIITSHLMAADTGSIDVDISTRAATYQSLRSMQTLLTSEEKEMSGVECLVSVLDRLGARYRIVEHASEGRTEEVSALRGSTLQQSAKMMVNMLKIGKKGRVYILSVIPGDKRVNKTTINAMERADSSMPAPEDRVESLTRCLPGAILPFSLFTDDLQVVVDPSLVLNPAINEIAFNITHTQSVFLNVEDYLRISHPLIREIV